MNHADDMMTEFDRWALRLLKAYLILLLVVLLAKAVAWWSGPDPPAPPVAPPRVVVTLTDEERRRIAERHRFHGITVSIEENGERYFIRDGRRHRL